MGGKERPDGDFQGDDDQARAWARAELSARQDCKKEHVTGGTMLLVLAVMVCMFACGLWVGSDWERMIMETEALEQLRATPLAPCSPLLRVPKDGSRVEV